MTLSSMFSRAKKYDKVLQTDLAEIVELLVSIGTKHNTPEALDLAELYGAWYIDLEHKIKTYDYSKEDAWYESSQTT